MSIERISLDDLQPNKDAFVGFIPLSKASEEATRRFTNEEAKYFLFEPIEDFVEQSISASVRHIQLRYEVNNSEIYTLCGSKEGSRYILYQLPGKYLTSEWTSPYSILPKPHIQIQEEHPRILSILLERVPATGPGARRLG